MPVSVMLDAGHGGINCAGKRKVVYPSKDDNDKYTLVPNLYN